MGGNLAQNEQHWKSMYDAYSKLRPTTWWQMRKLRQVFRGRRIEFWASCCRMPYSRCRLHQVGGGKLQQFLTCLNSLFIYLQLRRILQLCLPLSHLADIKNSLWLIPFPTPSPFKVSFTNWVKVINRNIQKDQAAVWWQKGVHFPPGSNK